MERGRDDLAVFVLGNVVPSTYLPEIVINVNSIGEITKHVFHLPQHIKKIAFIDDRTVFTNRHWITEAANLLDRCETCQLFESVYNVDAEGRMRFANHSVAYRYVNKMDGNLAAYDYGFAWAANRSWVEQIGLARLDVMAPVFCNYPCDSELSTLEKQWVNRSVKIKGNTGCVRGSILLQDYHEYRHIARFVNLAEYEPVHVECDVVIPYCQNNARWVRESIDSILNQSGCNPTVHVIADGFEPDTYLFDMPIHLYMNEKTCGPYVSANRIFGFLETDYIAIQDSDDIALPHRLHFSINEMLRTGTEMFGAGMRQFASYETADEESIDYVNKSPFHISSKNLTWSISPYGVVINGTRVMTKQLFEDMNGFGNYFMSGDCEFTTRCYNYDRKISTSDEIVALRRVHGMSLSRGKDYGLKSKIRESLHADIALAINEMKTLPKEKFGNLKNDYRSNIQRIK